ncbi:MAG: NADH-quinone oxidoreductase subunit J [endosymbiont of Escarpia spicata]|uniref:NADH-quinone oxidoreductase subunit J n=1 Tax=endosymbiont of Escarpia spicata TaxID=2200908 RepID=A0A370DQI3_9GAMM|nr:MAG: NADH-quinone oxidoreductase subunit J [endosymbiont of Escarpia spicata]
MNTIVLTVVLPLLAAFVVPVLCRVSPLLGRLLGPLTLAYAILLTLQVWLGMEGKPFSIALGGFQPPLGINFYVDRLSLLFTFLTLVTSLLLWPWRNETEPRQYALTLLLAASACGLALSGDLFNIYVFYELISVASFGLAAGAAFAASLRYLILSGLGSVLVLCGIAIVYLQTGTLNLAQLSQLAPETLNTPLGMSAFALILLGVGVKGELFPVNSWVPEVYAAASSRVSGLLAGLVSKLAVLVIVRLLVLLFQQESALQLMLILGLLGAISGELAAWRAKDMNRMLAFSSIGQLGVIFIAFSIPGETGLFAGLALSLHHLLVKPALFLLAERWRGSLMGLRGAGLASPVAGGMFVLLALSLVGMPPLPGFWAKFLLFTGLAAQQSVIYQVALGVVLLSIVIEANYLFRVVMNLFQPAGDNSVAVITDHGWLNLGTTFLLSALLIAGMLFMGPLGAWLEGVAIQAADPVLYFDTVFPVSAIH